MQTRTIVRSLFALLVVLSVASLGHAYVTYSDENENLKPTQKRLDQSGGSLTVVTTSERTNDGDRDNALIVYDEQGEVVNYNDTHRVYNDVDPVPGTKSTVLYVAANRLDRRDCHATSDCWRNVVEVMNLSTGETTRVFSHVTSMDRGQWHDVDRVGQNRLLVADIALDRVFIVNTSSGITEWEWDAQRDYPLEGGGLFPGDWTHVNDVSLLPDGRVMVSLRNQDQVVFVDRKTGLQENWTLGAEDNHSVLYEQHNPDYIPPSRGGPAVLVSDSENNRIVEYHRTKSGEWKLAWSWEDPQLMWPRDADRLPNGNTLITDSNGGRVLEINPDGEIVWSVTIDGAYDAERLGTGIESAGGHTADERYASASVPQSDGGDDRRGGPRETTDPSADANGPIDRLFLWLKGLAPRLVINIILYVLPPWMGFVEFTALVALLATATVWPLAELYWAGWSIQVQRNPPH